MDNNIKTPAQIKSFRRVIIALSVLIPIVIALLFEVKISDVDFSFLPPIYATINGATALLLIASLIAIKKKNIPLHRKLMRTALLFSLMFLALYIMYHISSESTPYGGEYAAIYYTVLISHIFLSVGVVPLVLFTYFYAWQGNYKRHKKWTRFSFPIWLYVAVTGVVVYLMISPYY